MLRDAFYLAKKDTKYLFKDWETWLWVFLMPIVFFFFFGTVTGGSSFTGSYAERIGLHAPADAGFLCDQLIRRLEAQDFQVDRLDTEDELAGYTRRLIIPEGFTASVLAGNQAKIELKRQGDDLGYDYDRIRIMRAVYAVLADLVVVSFDGDEPSAEVFEALASESRALTLEVTPAGERQHIPSGYEQAIPGIIVMFVMMMMFTAGSVTLLQERDAGILRRLASSPMSRGSVVAAKWASRMFLGLIQIVYGIAVGSLLFDLDWGPNLPALIPVLFAYAALAAALGLIVGNFGKSEGQVIGFAVIGTNIMAMLGGCWYPIEIAPEWAQKLALALPTGWAMDALHKLVSFGASPVTVIPHFVAMLLSALVAGYFASRHFRFV